MFLTLRRAAEYCGYRDTAFREYVKTYKIPRYGPKLNRFCKDDLEEFMREPSKFLAEQAPAIRARRKVRFL